MAVSSLPMLPLVLFGIIEPALLIWAYVIGMQDPKQYYVGQHPDPSLVSKASFPPQALSVSLQLVNVLLLLAAIAVICCFTKDSSVPKWYLIAVAFADYGHIYATYAALGDDYFWDVSKWNDMIWGNVGVSLFLNVARWLTVLGVFGRIGTGPAKGSDAKKDS